MRTINARVRLSNLLRDDLRPVEIDALWDSGAINLCIPDFVRRELGLEIVRTRTTEMTDGPLVGVGIVEPVTVKFQNRATTTTGMVGNRGAARRYSDADIDVLIDPRNERRILPPDRPNFALSKVK